MMDKEILLGRLKKQMVGTDEQIERFAALKYQYRKNCKALQLSFVALHKVHGGRHAQKGWGVSAATREERLVFVHTVAIDLYHLTFRIVTPKGFKQRHVVGLCRFWEAQGLSASALLKKKGMLKLLLSWANKDRLFEELTNEDLFNDTERLMRCSIKTEADEKVLLSADDMEWHPEPLLDVQSLLDNLLKETDSMSKVSSRRRRRFIFISGMIYWFGIREREAARFVFETDYYADDESMKAHILIKKYNGELQKLERAKVFIRCHQQLSFLMKMKELLPATRQLIPNEGETFRSWQKEYTHTAKDNGISSKLMRREYSKRLEKNSEETEINKAAA